MSSVKITGNASGSGVLTFSAPNTNSDRTIDIPDKAGSLALGAGAIVQVVQATKTDTAEVTGTSFADVTGMSVAITPASTSNKILVLLNVHYSTGADGAASILLLRGSTEIFKGDASSSRERVTIGGVDLTNTNNALLTMDSASACYLDSPSTTSSTTYKIQLRGRTSYGSGYINRTPTDNDDSTSGKRAVSSITVMEVQG